VIDSITLKDDYTFLVSDRAGEVTEGPEGYGLYSRDTRYLSRLELTVNGEKPPLLSSTVDYNLAAAFRLSAGHQIQLEASDSSIAPGWTTLAHAVGITRQRFIKGGLVESLEFVNYHATPVKLAVELRLGADFWDIFEVRGFPRENPGYQVEATILGEGQAVTFKSFPTAGNSGTARSLAFECSHRADRYELLKAIHPLSQVELPEVVLHYDLELLPHRPFALEMTLIPDPAQAGNGNPQKPLAAREALDFTAEVARMRQVFSGWQQDCTQVQTGDYVLDKIFEIATLDLRSLMQQQPQGLVVTAGLPWYFTLFGRDSLITALETLSLNPQIAVDTLRGLAAYQATEFNDWRDSEPGKILHELRLGDMTLSGEMPHGPYYGSVDSTLLFILCFAETLKWREDAAFFAELWPAVERGLKWAEEYGDIDRDGYIEFSRRSKRGILHQGWKDSDESMGGSIGPRPSLPIALVEVQGYYYAALVAVAETLRHFGDTSQKELATQLEARAARLKANFNRDFWWPEEGFFAQALDGQKKPVRNVTSNPGHCLWSGIVDEAKAGPLVARLMRPDMLSGWGLRTMSTLDPTYNPMSYHNGSVWPHDNALIVAGLRRYGFQAEALKVATQLFEAAATFPGYRLPELYCGFAREETLHRSNAPAAYPVSCSPQAWAAGTPALLLQSLLGLEVNLYRKTVHLAPILPDMLKELRLGGLRVGHHRIDLIFTKDSSNGLVNLTQSQVPANNQELTIELAPGFAKTTGIGNAFP
jgi:glycogen debranching enzyme